VVAVCDGRAWSTPDAGATWTAAAVPAPRSFEIGGVKYALTAPPSDDGGAVELRRSDEVVARFDDAYLTQAMAIGGDAGVLLVVGIQRGGMGRWDWVVRSVDGGRSWTRPNRDPTSESATDGCAWTAVWALGERAILAGDGGCSPQVSTDRGATFHRVGAVGSSAWGTPKALLVGGPSGVFVSVDDGVTWVDRTPR
jgi:hypothetical protein